MIESHQEVRASVSNQQVINLTQLQLMELSLHDTDLRSSAFWFGFLVEVGLIRNDAGDIPHGDTRTTGFTFRRVDVTTGEAVITNKGW